VFLLPAKAGGPSEVDARPWDTDTFFLQLSDANAQPRMQVEE